MTIINVHNYEFEIDTCDWYNMADGDIVNGLIEEKLFELTPKQAKDYHTASKRFETGEVDDDHPALEALRQICNECASVVLDTYKSKVTSGHNYMVYAYTDDQTTNPIRGEVL